MKYLVKLSPLEPFFFGTEQTFQFPGEKKSGKETYFIRSKDVPEQTTILGMLRFVLLEQEGILNSDFEYSGQDMEKMQKLIGKRSFAFGTNEVQEFGSIHSISPVFLINGQEQYLVKTPFHNKGTQGYHPIEMTPDIFETSSGKISLPKPGEYDSKKGHASGYYNLETGAIENDLFHAAVMTGNRKNGRESDEDSFFKREMKLLNQNYAFAAFVDADRLPEQTICYMGQRRSAFAFTAKPASNDLEDRVRNAFSQNGGNWYYALSDIVVPQGITYSSFAIVEEKQLRNLETIYQEKRHIRRMRRSETQLNLIEKGSVFYQECPLNLDNENHKKIGYNCIVKLGGSK